MAVRFKLGFSKRSSTRTLATQRGLFDANEHPRGQPENAGEFVKKGTASPAAPARAKPQHGERSSALRARFQAMRQARMDAFNELKADAEEAKAKADEHWETISNDVDDTHWIAGGEPDDPILAEHSKVFAELEDLKMQEPGTLAEQFQLFGEIRDKAKEALAINDKVKPGKAKGEDQLTAEEVDESRKRLQAIVISCKAGRERLCVCAEHRREMKAIRDGEVYESSRPTMLATHHAPAGYTRNRPLTFQGHQFVGGQFIPDDLVQAMPAAMRAKLEQRSEGLFDEPVEPAGEPQVEQPEAQALAPGAADPRVAAALARAEQFPDPHWNDAEAHRRAAAAFESLPVGTPVVSLDELSRGQLGKIVKNDRGRNCVHLAGHYFLSNDVEPLDEKLSWRVAKHEAQVQTEKPIKVPVDELIRKREEEFAASRMPNGKEQIEENEYTDEETAEPKSRAVSHDNDLAGKSTSGDQERLRAGGRMGIDAGEASASPVPGKTEGIETDRRRAELYPGDDGERDELRGPTGKSGDESAVGKGVGAGATVAEDAGRGGQAGAVGDRGRGAGRDGRSGEVADPSPAERVEAEPPSEGNPTDLTAGNFRYTSRDFAFGGLKAKFQNNLEALRALQTIRVEGRDTATPEEQAILSRYVGWGQFPHLFGHYPGDDWKREAEQLKAIMKPEEYDAARRSTLNAHYTSPDVVDAHWKMAERLGFKGGRFLETSAGIGYYLGLMPEQLAGKTRSSAVELDPLTGGILKMLYPKADVNIQGFQEHQAPDNFYDLIASNVPFGDYKVHDPRYNKHQANIHDYFFLKSLDLLRPGGLMMHITSTGTMDKADDHIRQELAKNADLVAAIRFPQGAHKAGAGTDVVTDLLILRKRLPGEEAHDEANWMETVAVPDPAGGEAIPVNKYFAEHPEQILGTLDRSGTMYRGDSVNVSRTDDYEERLQQAIERLPAGLVKPFKAPAERFSPKRLPAPGDVKDGGYKIENGKLFVREGGAMIEQAANAKQLERIRGQLAIRDAVRAVINAQINSQDATGPRAALNRVYDSYIRTHGFLNERANKWAFRSDPDSPVLLALEQWSDKTKTASKAAMFSKDTIRAAPKVERAGSVAEGVGVSLHENGSVDVDHIAKLTGQHPEHVAKSLVKEGLAYQDPSEGWKPADQYLSGNVRRKLTLARAAAANDPKFAANVAALEKVQPEDVDHAEINVKLGAPWVPPSDIADFAADLLAGGKEHFTINFLPSNGQWMADFSKEGLRRIAGGRAATELWATGRKDAMDILEAALNGSPLTVYDKSEDGKPVLNRQETDAAMSKAQEMKDAFKRWVWDDDSRRERLHRYYNDNFNNVRQIRYDGSHQTFPGLDPAFKPHAHIPNFVWQVVTTGKGLAAHEVGMGKTAAMVMSAMELRRLGLARKPVIACLKSNIEQITADALRMYPGASILSTVDKFDAADRKKTISQIATGDYDLVILTHDNLDMLQMKPETVTKYISEEIRELEAAKKASEEQNPKKNNRVVKALEKAKLRLEARLKDALDESKKDDAVYFEELGADMLFVDEAHKYKSLPCYTKQERVKGIPNTRSDRATSMLMRTRWLMDQNNGRGVVFATGTPVANTMAELYNVQRYLQPQDLKDRNISSFDAWANTFGDIQTKIEPTATGEYKPVSRFANFVNIPELMQMARQIMDVQRVDTTLNSEGKPIVVRPHRKDSVVVAPNSDAIKGMMADLQQRAKELKKGGQPQKGDDNMLSICVDGAKGSLDMRLLHVDAADDPQSKLNLAIQNVLKIHKERPAVAQIIFSDIGVNPVASGFHLYKDVIDKLVAGGIPRGKIADFSKLEGPKKDAAQDAMRRGEIVVAIGSTDKLGTGVNVQNNLAALHHLDVPYQPAQVEQRDGRAWRQGNQNKDIDIFRYVTERSLDEMRWQIIATKTNFIKQVVTGTDTKIRTAREEDAEELTPEQISAAASGDPRILERVNVDEDVKRLEADRDRHEHEQIKLKKAVAESEKSVPQIKKRAEGLVKDVKHLESQPDFAFKIGGTTYDERKDALAALSVKAKEADDLWANTPSWRRDDLPDAVPMGSYRGFEVVRPIRAHAKGGFVLYGPSGEAYPTGDSLSSLEYVARNLPKEQTKIAADLERTGADMEKIKASIGKPFEKAEELKAKLQRQKELNEALGGKQEEKRRPPIEIPGRMRQEQPAEQSEYPPNEKRISPINEPATPPLEQPGQPLKEETHYHNRSFGHGRRADIEQRSDEHPQVGEVVQTKNGLRIIVKARPPQFISDDWIEDNDAWSEYPDGPGWYAGYETIAGDKLPESIKAPPTTSPEPAATKPETASSGKHVVIGNTFPNREAIKRLGGRWNPNNKTWTIPANVADKLPRGLSSRPVTLSTRTASPRPIVRYRLVFSQRR